MRSALYVPGDAPGKLAGAARWGADELIVDLEDAVPAARKAEARRAVADWLAGAPQGPRSWVRINPGEAGAADLHAVTWPVLAGVCMAKAETYAQLIAVNDLLSELEKARGIEPGTFGIVPLLESASAVLDAPRLARAPRVVRLQIGEADLRADLGVEPGPDERELLFARSQVVLASAAAGIEAPMAPVSTDFRDLDGLRASTAALKRLGFGGRACIHPAQIQVVNEVFTPSADEVARAHDLIVRYEAAATAGDGVCVDADGRLVDEAVVRSARRLLARRGRDGRGRR
ncbi:CoA ester lyase [Actinomadura barringtoniae]|uniref:CoA ester lyase n=1 Tax=Actinomadura barringtoniae TaxID=1427535 RepID=A0A939PG18_9ACTN|nr:CoA ester lyase [Actinomadura barringtoniae]MBO2447841.1 CoA ester lyase [Actinomadura barringtoniae]